MTGRGLAALRQYANQPIPAERCELCSLPLGAGHQHLLDPPSRRIVCACDACALLFTVEQTGSSTRGTKFRRIPRDVRALRGFQLPDAHWAAFGIPVGLVFFFHSTVANQPVALYPSPAGPAEAPLDLPAWEDLVTANPTLQTMLPDVEALLVNRLGSVRDAFLAPIDRCYELTGLLRRHWQGWAGGDDAWSAIHAFFDRLREEARA